MKDTDVHPLEHYTFLVASANISLYFFVLLVSAFMFGAGFPISRLNLVLALLMTIGYCACAVRGYYTGRWVRHYVILLTLAAILVWASMLIAGKFMDLSYDGMCYHQEGIISLFDGWDPFRGDISQQNFPHLGHMALVLNSYAKAPWIFATAVYKVTGNIDHGKSMNILLIIASGCLSFSSLRIFKGLGRAHCVLISVLGALCPVAVVQFMGYYVDGQLFALILSFLAVACGVYHRADRYALCLLAMITAIALNIKLTGVLYIGFFSVAFVMFLLITRGIMMMKKIVLVLAIGGAMGVCVIGYNPYMTNTLVHGHPFYPLNEKDSGLMNYKGPREFGAHGTIANFLLSNFVASDHTWETTGKTRIKMPFTFSRNELLVFNIPDTTIGGFGPLWSGGILLAVLILCIMLARDYRNALAGVYIIAVILTSILAKPYAWYARYNPQLWLVPMVAMVMAFTYKNGIVRMVGYALAAVLAVNIFLIADQYISFQVIENRNIRNSLRQVAAMPAPVKVYFSVFRSQRLRFQNANIRYEEVFRREDLPCRNPLLIDCMNASVCPRESPKM
ncbi:MAG: hypothetical protein NTZ78_11775 [Candidatus Aureabacteria bacterium]|nr:hypothetical protein [Candidatus Auribacterota bacterium]